MAFSQKALIYSHNVSVYEEKALNHCNANFNEKKNLKNHFAIVHERKIVILWPTDNKQFNHDVVKKDWKI